MSRSRAVAPPPAGALPSGHAKTQMVRQMFDAIAPRYDLVNRLMTFGLDQGWRRRTVAALELAPRSVVCDLACGTGDLLALLGDSGFTSLGVDLSFGMLAAAAPGRRARLVEADGSRLPLPDGALDGIVSGFALRNFTDLGAVFAEAARALRPGGRVALLDVDTPATPLLRQGHEIWFTRVVPRLGGLLSDAAAYRYLPRSVAYLPDAAEMRRLLEGAGFADVVHRRLSGGIVQLVTATRSGGRGAPDGRGARPAS